MSFLIIFRFFLSIYMLRNNSICSIKYYRSTKPVFIQNISFSFLFSNFLSKILNEFPQPFRFWIDSDRFRRIGSLFPWCASTFLREISLFLHLGFVLVQRGIRTRDLKPVEEKIFVEIGLNGRCLEIVEKSVYRQIAW